MGKRVVVSKYLPWLVLGVLGFGGLLVRPKLGTASPGLPALTPLFRHSDEYMVYLTSVLPNALGFKKQVLEAIAGMFDALEEQRKPLKCNITFQGQRLTVNPIGFSLPKHMFQPYIPDKAQSFGSVIPGNISTYLFRVVDTNNVSILRHQQEAYYRDMSRSLFCITFGKSGWDCLRHLEILAAGCVPLFTDIDLVTPHMLSGYPKHLFQVLLGYPGLSVTGKRVRDNFTLALNEAAIDQELYIVIVSALLHYSRSVLSTEGMARYFLRRVTELQGPSARPVRKVLCLVPDMDVSRNGDYQFDTLLHGLKAVLSQSAVVDYVRRRAVAKTPADFSETQYTLNKITFYGHGFSFALQGMELPHSVDRTALQSRIEQNEFDLIVIGNAWKWSPPPFYDVVCAVYPRHQVALVFGSDGPINKETLEQYAPCVGMFFSRELLADQI